MRKGQALINWVMSNKKSSIPNTTGLDYDSAKTIMNGYFANIHSYVYSMTDIEFDEAIALGS